MSEKICNKCSRSLPATAEYFFRHKKMKGGLTTVCKECSGRKFGLIRKQSVSENGLRTCTKCERKLPETLEYFFKRKNGRGGLMEACKECMGRPFMKKIVDGDYKKCPRCKETFPYTAEYFDRNSRSRRGLAHTCKKCASYYHKTFASRNKALIQQRSKRYYQENKDLYRLQEHKRYALKRNLPNTFTREQWKASKLSFGNSCAYCGEAGKLSQDHFIAVTKGGEYTVNNIVPACGRCNRSKSNRDFFVWYKQQTFYSKCREKKIIQYLGYKQGTQQLALI